MLQSYITCSANATVLLMEHPYPHILPGILFTNLPATVRAPVIYQQQLKIRKGLCKNTVNALGQVLFYLINGYYNGYFRKIIHIRSFYMKHCLHFYRQHQQIVG